MRRLREQTGQARDSQRAFISQVRSIWARISALVPVVFAKQAEALTEFVFDLLESLESTNLTTALLVVTGLNKVADVKFRWNVRGWHLD